MKNENLRVAFFPDAYHEMDGVANTSRHFEAFAKKRALPFLIVHAGSRNETVKEGSVTRVQLRRSWLQFPLDRTHEFDPMFLRHYRELALLIRQFRPDVVQITGPSDVGILGALIAHRHAIPLAASWQILQFNTPGPCIIITLTILFLHMVSANLLIPKFIAPRVSIGPVAATVGILFWGWLWGVMGLLLAVPLTAFVKLVADLHPSLCHLSNMLALTPRTMPRWVRYGETALERAIPYLRGRPGLKTGGACNRLNG